MFSQPQTPWYLEDPLVYEEICGYLEWISHLPEVSPNHPCYGN